jgi:hypothetical protein
MTSKESLSGIGAASSSHCSDAAISFTRGGICWARLDEMSSWDTSFPKSDLLTTCGIGELLINSHVGNVERRVDSDEYRSGGAAGVTRHQGISTTLTFFLVHIMQKKRKMER